MVVCFLLLDPSEFFALCSLGDWGFDLIGGGMFSEPLPRRASVPACQQTSKGCYFSSGGFA